MALIGDTQADAVTAVTTGESVKPAACGAAVRSRFLQDRRQVRRAEEKWRTTFLSALPNHSRGPGNIGATRTASFALFRAISEQLVEVRPRACDA